MFMEINIHYAKTHLSRLLEKVASGEDVIIAKAGKPVARLVPVQNAPQKRTLGTAKGRFQFPEDFNAPLPPEVAESFWK